MKTAVSIPDPIFESAEQLAHRLGMSRSELYSKAITSYIQEHRNDSVTEALNKIYSEESSELDPVIQEIQFLSIPEERW